MPNHLNVDSCQSSAERTFARAGIDETCAREYATQHSAYADRSGGRDGACFCPSADRDLDADATCGAPATHPPPTRPPWNTGYDDAAKLSNMSGPSERRHAFLPTDMH